MKNMNFRNGFSLVEVLVALVILSVGMLGVLTLQVKGLQFGQSAMINTKAINAASDMADRIRANPNAIADYAVAFEEGGTEPATSCADSNGAQVTDPCSAADLAAYDIWQWKSQMLNTSGLPEGDGAITVIPGNGAASFDNYVIDLKWVERGEEITYQVSLNF